MKKLQKILVPLLIASLLLGSLTLFASADAPKKNEDPVIVIEGFVSTDTVDAETGEHVFPPTSKTIAKAVRDAVTPVVKSTLRGEFRGLDYPLNQAVLSLLDGLRCDENGDPIHERTTTAYVWTSEEDILKSYDEESGYNYVDAFRYSYDWRLDMRTLAEQLHDYIEYVLEVSGVEKVDIVAYSMGTCVASSYLYTYGGEYIDSVVMYLGALQGSSSCGDPFENHLGTDPELIMAAVNAFLGGDLKKEILKTLIDVLYQEGVVEITAAIAEQIVDRVFDNLYRQSMPYIFGRIPGFWAMIPAEDYDTVRNTFAAGVVTEEFLEKVDYYHDVQLSMADTFDSVIEEGTKVAVIAKYGYPLVPIIRSRYNASDFVVDLEYASVGATCSRFDETLPEDYEQAGCAEHDHISPDRKVDASTCALPESTWFIKNSSHLSMLTGGTEAEAGLIDFICTAEGQPTVWDSAAYPQYLIYTGSNELAPMTAENDYDMLGNYKKPTFLERFKNFFADIKKLFSLVFAAIKGGAS